MTTRTATCPVGNHEFTYEVKTGTDRIYCSDKHAWKARAAKAKERKAQMAHRRCSRCKKMKSADEFAGPTAAYCKPCMNDWARENRAANPDPLRSRRDSLARYGLTFEQFDAMLAAQGGRCKVCGTTEPGDVRAGPRGWHVDHDHACCGTRKRSCGRCIRGIICANCNRALGLLHEDPAVVQAMLDYLLAYRVRREAEGHLGLLEPGGT